MAETVEGHMERIRDLVNDARFNHGGRRSREQVNRIYAAMDVVEDAHLALREYHERQEDGVRYLELYGVMQALILQQDGVRTLMEALEIEGYPTDDVHLQDVRRIRNHATGHPTQSDRGKSTHHVSRISITKSSFTLAGFKNDTDERKFEEVDTLHLIEDQEKRILAVLPKIVAKLGEGELEHRRAFRSEKLSELLPVGAGYLTQKIAEAGRDLTTENTAPAEAAISAIRSSMTAFEGALERRCLGREVLPGIEDVLAELAQALGAVESRLPGGPMVGSTEERAVVIRSLAGMVQRRLDDLAQAASELDDQYASDVVELPSEGTAEGTEPDPSQGRDTSGKEKAPFPGPFI